MLTHLGREFRPQRAFDLGLRQKRHHVHVHHQPVDAGDLDGAPQAHTAAVYVTVGGSADPALQARLAGNRIHVDSSGVTSQPRDHPLEALDDAEVEELFQTLTPIARVVVAGGDVPAATPMGLRRDDLDDDSAHLD